MAKLKKEMTDGERKKFEFELTKQFTEAVSDTKQDLLLRVSGVPARAGSSGYQFVGYTKLEEFYRGDQWTYDKTAGASQKTDNYCAVIVDNISSLIFDDEPEVNCPTADPTDDLEEIKAEARENLIQRVWDDNDARVEFDEWAKVTSLYGDGFLKGPFMEKDEDGKWKIRFSHVENPGSIRLLYADAGFKKLLGFVDENRISLLKATMLYKDKAEARGIKLQSEISKPTEGRRGEDTQIPMVNIREFWTDSVFAVFINEKLLDYDVHNWGFVPLEYIKNIHSPNHPYGKSDLEDIIDPQLSHNETNNDLANLLKWISTVNLWGKNLEGMQALVAGLSRIYSLPEDGEIHTFEKPGDPYITNTYVQQRRSAIVDIAGISESMLSSSQVSASSGRALALAFQGTIRKLRPRMARFETSLQHLNRNILKLYEIYFPQTKVVIEGNYRNKVFLPATILRNIVDTLNKLSGGLISLDTAMKEAGVKQVRLEQRLMKKNLSDPIIGPQIARQPALLPRLQEGQNQPGEQPIPGPGQRFSSPEGAVAASAQQASGAAPSPVTP